MANLTAIRQSVTYQYILTDLALNSPNISLPILGDKPIHQYFPHHIIVLYGPAIECSLSVVATVILEYFEHMHANCVYDNDITVHYLTRRCVLKIAFCPES